VEDLSDIEREEQLRRWWSENWAWIIGGVALGLSLLAGWQYWQRSHVQSAERDEAAYVAVLEALGRNQRDEAASQARRCGSDGRIHPMPTRPNWRSLVSRWNGGTSKTLRACCAAWPTARRTGSSAR
jgi:hypothetical protein